MRSRHGVGLLVEPGFGYTRATHHLDLMARKCSVGPWKTLDLGAVTSTARRGRRTVRLADGHAVLYLTGATGAPQVTLTGPHGQRITIPRNSTKPLMVPGFMVFQDPHDKTTCIAIQPSAGTWHVALEPGSSLITSIRGAGLLPDPSVTAHVSGSGRHRTLSWRMRPIPGQRITFWEKGRDSAQIIGSTSASRGSLRFTLANGSARQRSIVAQVISYNLPRKDLAVASYVAPAPTKPSRPGHVRVSAVRGGAVRVSWTAAAFAQEYLVAVDTSDGAHLVEFAGGRARSLVIHDVVPITAATVTVIGELNTGITGPGAKVKFHAPRAKTGG